MEIESSIPTPTDFSFSVEDDLGEIIKTEWQCPGVWYVANEGNGRIACEYYIAQRDTAAISDAAKSYGMFLEHHPDLLVYRLDEPERGRDIIQYEIARYRAKHHLPQTDDEQILTKAVFGMENAPEYFGSYPAPIYTPHGIMTRYKVIDNGIFVLETDQGERMVAVCYPIADANFSDYAKLRMEQTGYDRKNGIDNTLGYFFFSEDNGNAALALFELLDEFPDILSGKLIDPAALHNALWQYHPNYVAMYNRQEQEGLHDCLALLMRLFGVEDVEPAGWPERLTTLTIGAGTDYLKF